MHLLKLFIVYHYLQWLILLLHYYNCFTAPWTVTGTTRLSRYQKGKTNLDLLEQETVSGSGTHTFTHTHTFNGLFSRTTWVSRHQKDKPFWILLKQEMMGGKWHQLDRMQIICTTLQTDSSLNFLWARCSSWCPTNSVKALKAVAVVSIL